MKAPRTTPDFAGRRTALNAARLEWRDARRQRDVARRLVARIEAQKAQAARTSAKAASAIDDRLAAAKAAEAEIVAQLARLAKANGVATTNFERFSDPRKAIARWDDQTPILLLPVRLETRFKTVAGEAGERQELWVRVYPDDCSVDNFDAGLSEAELASGRRYWIEEWAAGGIEAQRSAAWRNLVSGHGAGRAAWIVHEYKPAGAAPAKANETDILLVIATDAPPSNQEATARGAFWRAIWIAAGDGVQTEAAFQALSGAPGVIDAAALIDRFVPANLDTRPISPATRQTVVVRVDWLELPAQAADKTQSWSSPPRLNVQPDRFVVLGYQDGKVVFEALGAMIPPSLVAGPDPGAPEEERLKHLETGDLGIPDDLRWLVDFDVAVANGMGVKIELDPAKVDLNRPIEQLLAIGIRLADDAEASRLQLEELIAHHRYGQSGFSLLPQGTPTNNTDAAPAGYSRIDDADAAFDALFGNSAKLNPVEDWWQRQDGQWLSEALGVDLATFDRVPGAGRSDMSEARAMNRALWPATFAYTMQTMMHPIFGDAEVEATRWFYTHFVSGRGMLPALRLGHQPYGVLPVSALSKWTWLKGDALPAVGGLEQPAGFLAYRRGLSSVLGGMRTDWLAMASSAARVGAGGDAHQTLLDIIGLHPASVEFHQRYAQSLDHIFNHARLRGVAGQILEYIGVQNLQAEAMSLLERLGYTGKLEPDALSKFFFTRANRLNGPIIDDVPLSESKPVRDYTDDGRNYLEWLLDTARGSFEDFRLERGFTGDEAPDALLYVMLRHALLLGYWDSSIHLMADAGVMLPEAVRAARHESAFIHVDEATTGESRYEALQSTDVRVSGAADRTVAQRITEIVGARGTAGLADQLDALGQLRGLPTARLERCLAEHVDTATNRLDAWLLGLVNYQLAALRYPPAGPGVGKAQARRGIYLGAYGWLEGLKRRTGTLEPVKLEGDLALEFGEDPVLRDPANGGYILTPSVAHATTASVLRAGYLANASAQNPEALAVNLSSARVRVALGLIEGIRNGQPLGALLGYRYQRGLHEGHPGLQLDRFIAPLRKLFPLVADQLASTATPEGTPIEAIEANNVVDGMKFAEHLRTTGGPTYPFGLDLPSANDAERAALGLEADALLDAYDSLADLALSEGVHQAVLGNYDRVASTLDAYAKGTFPPEPEVSRTPRSGLGLTHRMGLHFEAGVDPTASPVAGIAVTPRSRAQAMVNRWLAGMLPDPDEAGCLVRWFDPAVNVTFEDVVTQRKLGLQPIDVLHLLTLDAETALGELEDRILAYVFAAHAPRPDAAISIVHTSRLAAPRKSFFELAPLVRHLRSLVLRSRPLQPTDLSLSGEAERTHDLSISIDRNRVQGVLTALDTLRQDLANAQVAAPVDAAIPAVVALFDRAARFGIQQVGWGFIFEWRRRTYGELMRRVAEVADRWDARLAAFTAGLTAYDALPGATPDENRYAELGRLDLLVAGNVIAPRPASAEAYRNGLPARRSAFAAKRAQLATILATNDSRIVQLIAAIEAQLPLTDFDLTPFSIADTKDDVAHFLTELAGRVAALKDEVARRLAVAQRSLTEHDLSADPAVRVARLQDAGRAMLGEDFRLVPEFRLGAAQAAEVQNAIDASNAGSLTQYARSLTQSDLVVDDWMHGVARVREKVYALEQAGALAATIGRAEPDLQPIQLPFKAGENWLALEFDPAKPPDGERLLYTAHHAVPFDPAQPTCGLLIDEWTEVVPARDETIGLAVHYDRPGSEPPQTWLLVTPAQMDGHWHWSDLVDALPEAQELARLRAVEPAQVDATVYARFLPATTSAVSLYGISIAANLARVNRMADFVVGDNDG